MNLSDYVGPEFYDSKKWQPGFKAWVALSTSLREFTSNQEHKIDFDKPAEDNLPRFPSTLHYIERQCGGFYGLTVLLGAQKCGKTMLALASCIEAAATMTWQVVYFSAELDEHEISLRLKRYFDANPGSLDCEHFLHVVHVGKGQGPEDLVTDIESCTDPEGPPILICLDSINTIAELSGREYLKTLKDYALWAMMSRRMSNGAASFLIVSETNVGGGAKGGKLEFWGDVVVKMKKASDTNTGIVPVKMDLTASRRTGGEGFMGTYYRNMARGRFQKEEEIEAPRIVSAGRSNWYDDL